MIAYIIKSGSSHSFIHNSVTLLKLPAAATPIRNLECSVSSADLGESCSPEYCGPLRNRNCSQETHRLFFLAALYIIYYTTINILLILIKKRVIQCKIVG